MAVALAPEAGSPLASVYEEAGTRLERAKAADKDCISVLGRVLEWRHLADAAELKDTLARMVVDFGSSSQFLSELSGVLPEGRAAAGRTGPSSASTSPGASSGG